jgi:hypothetical protein
MSHTSCTLAVQPAGVTVDPSSGIVYMADMHSHVVRGVFPNGTIATAVGTGAPGFADGGGACCCVSSPVSASQPSPLFPISPPECWV